MPRLRLSVEPPGKLQAGGKPSTWLPPGRLVELFSVYGIDKDQ